MRFQKVTGRIVYKGEVEKVPKSNKGDLSKGFSLAMKFAVKNRTGRRQRLVLFTCFNDEAKFIRNQPLDTRVDIDYVIDSKLHGNGNWYTDLFATAIKLHAKPEKRNK